MSSMFRAFCSSSRRFSRSCAQALRGSAVKIPIGCGFCGKHGASLRMYKSCDAISSSDRRPRSPAFTGTQYIWNELNWFDRTIFPWIETNLISTADNNMLIAAWLWKILTVTRIAWTTTWPKQSIILCHAKWLIFLTRSSSLFLQFAAIDQLFMLHYTVDNLCRKTSDIIDRCKFAWRQNHAWIWIDWQRQTNIHVHVVEPVIVRLSKFPKQSIKNRKEFAIFLSIFLPNCLRLHVCRPNIHEESVRGQMVTWIVWQSPSFAHAVVVAILARDNANIHSSLLLNLEREALEVPEILKTKNSCNQFANDLRRTFNCHFIPTTKKEENKLEQIFHSSIICKSSNILSLHSSFEMINICVKIDKRKKPWVSVLHNTHASKFFSPFHPRQCDACAYPFQLHKVNIYATQHHISSSVILIHSIEISGNVNRWMLRTFIYFGSFILARVFHSTDNKRWMKNIISGKVKWTVFVHLQLILIKWNSELKRIFRYKKREKNSIFMFCIFHGKKFITERMKRFQSAKKFSFTWHWRRRTISSPT